MSLLGAEPSEVTLRQVTAQSPGKGLDCFGLDKPNFTNEPIDGKESSSALDQKSLASFIIFFLISSNSPRALAK